MSKVIPLKKVHERAGEEQPPSTRGAAHSHEAAHLADEHNRRLVLRAAVVGQRHDLRLEARRLADGAKKVHVLRLQGVVAHDGANLER